ncbi:putative bifunctional diguanylate cyclase/phosphodiesterase [Brucella sp. RRSP16]|uniref:putative bifunctional diguanylate cyclase/phosphodiesterase n=1 Tax=Brucella TaxID=234 RepID=UPI0004693690|nr:MULTISPECIES: EAL domain-containing protein [Brucella/Ochrobactrum group]KAB2668931.1 EAL domain-containing protein [Ochrobactrum sp. LMG 5442]PJR94053.1 GGDEF domain-containing protein [Ochrobactrum sp. 721/2009]PJT17335.1 GGDEF domain-containing protein [Ochrobactrum sp. 720/2009]PJT18140.1 GGDEF domain-containing protein [Ochrobactrum sp. 715/2009]PJT30684.1 GGDEF domain-containing protein [Ochrobactrum sp. 695/2009]PJT34901.1 GGDEF domain-containing protein [Ochrobactrum sp. 689/2009]
MWQSRKPEIPADVRLSFLRALYGNRTTLWFGLLAHVVACVVIYVKTDDWRYLMFAGVFAIVAVGRIFDMHKFDQARQQPLSHADLDRWETRYLIGASAVCLTLGMLCFFSSFVLRDSFAELASLTVLLASVVSIVGRNYASAKAVILMSACTLLPVLAGLILAGTPFHVIIGLLLIPYFLSNIQMANGLREFLFAAVMGKRRLSIVAGRFDAALNNMPQGLLMFDSQQRIAVINNKAKAMLQIAEHTKLHGRKLDVLLRYCAKKGLFPQTDLKSVHVRMQDLLIGKRARDIFQLSNQRYIECIGNQTLNEGAVLMFEDVTQRVEAEARIQHMARYDGLTGLPNRNYFETMVRSLRPHQKKGTQVALIVIDINHFKHVNDTLGHHTGDVLLRLFAERLNSLDPQRFVASRFGGDEFVVFVFNLRGEADIAGVMDHIMAVATGVYDLDGDQVQIDISAGVAIENVERSDVGSMHINADLALYEAKSTEEKSWSVFVDAMDTKYRGRQKLKADLRLAINHGEIKVVYQPIVSAQSLRVVACEALARWEHPELGFVPPAEFIPLAEEMGIITDITRFMLEQACADCLSWGDRIGVSVNLSAIDLKSNDIARDIANALQKSGLPAHRLEVEVTESAIISDRNKTSMVLQRLKNAGINIALDDFGTGYSSLSYLNTLPLTKVKVDRSFVRDITTDRRSLMLLRGVTQLSHELGLGVTVEGVETEEQLALIRVAAGADLVQGYLLGMPVPVEAISAMTAKAAARRDGGRTVA